MGKDVALALGYKNPQEAIRTHVDDEDKGVSEILTPGGKQKIPVINVSGLKDSLDKAEAAAKDLPGVQKDLDAAKAELESVKKDGWKDKHDALKKEFEDYKAGVNAKETKAAKEAAARAYYESKGITGKALDIAMRGSTEEISALELEDGKIKDAAALEALVKGDFSGLLSSGSGVRIPDGSPTKLLEPQWF